MSLMRCDSCGSLRWSLRSKAGDSAPQRCEVCGEPLKLERRRPGRRFSREAREKPERRDVHLPGPPRAPAA